VNVSKECLHPVILGLVPRTFNGNKFGNAEMDVNAGAVIGSASIHSEYLEKLYEPHSGG